MIDSQDEQFVGMPLIVDPKRRNAPAAHESARAKTRNRAIEFPVGQALDAARDLGVEVRGSCWIPFVEICDRVDDVGDRLFGIGDLQRPRAASMISRARFAS